MYPQQPNQTPLSPGSYDFITSPSGSNRQAPLAGASKTKRIIIVVAGVFLLLILFVGAKNILSSGNNNSAALLKVINRQQELVNITTAATASTQPLSSSSSAIAVTTQATVASAQSQLLAYLKKAGTKVNKKQLLYPNAAAVNAQLAAAASAGTYDTTLQQVLNSQLTDYQLSLKQAYAKTSGARGRELLQKEYDGATLLLRQFNPQS